MNKINISVFLFFCVCLSSCCKQKDTLSGQAIQEIFIEHLYEEPGSSCFNLPSQICIRTDSAYHELFKLKSGASCDALVLPFIDFSKYSLLIYWKEDGARVFYNTNVQIDSTQKTVQFSIGVTGQCACPDKCLRQEYHLVLTPKIADDYVVFFQ